MASSNYDFNGSECQRKYSSIEAVPVTYNTAADRYEMEKGSTTTIYGAIAAVPTIQAAMQHVDTNAKYMRIQARRETLPEAARLGIGFGAAVFAMLLIAGVYLGIRCCRRNKERQSPDEGDNFSMEISGVHYELREEYGPKPISRCSTCDSEVLHAECGRPARTEESNTHQRARE